MCTQRFFHNLVMSFFSLLFCPPFPPHFFSFFSFFTLSSPFLLPVHFSLFSSYFPLNTYAHALQRANTYMPTHMCVYSVYTYAHIRHSCIYICMHICIYTHIHIPTPTHAEQCLVISCHRVPVGCFPLVFIIQHSS